MGPVLFASSCHVPPRSTRPPRARRAARLGSGRPSWSGWGPEEAEESGGSVRVQHWGPPIQPVPGLRRERWGLEGRV